VDILNRNQFIDKFNYIFRYQGQLVEDDEHPLWVAEKSYTPRIFCNFFICVKPINLEEKDIHWRWVNKTLNNKIACFSSDGVGQEEWWGFVDEKDILLWTLKWVK